MSGPRGVTLLLVAGSRFRALIHARLDGKASLNAMALAFRFTPKTGSPLLRHATEAPMMGFRLLSCDIVATDSEAYRGVFSGLLTAIGLIAAIVSYGLSLNETLPADEVK